mmetsp:Transcript_25186/g.44773  ORF Transcript_25186/g.44773 Transcript_25186/m.44773 type:complete len:127 (-) Transcript_25186:481-861(-)
MTTVRIREERKDDIPAIFSLTRRAFEMLDLSAHNEEYIVDSLREADALAVSLVAEKEDSRKVVGHLTYSLVKISDGSEGRCLCYLSYQRLGIGSKLINHGLKRLREMKANGCVLVGHPEYYKRVRV